MQVARPAPVLLGSHWTTSRSTLPCGLAYAPLNARRYQGLQQPMQVTLRVPTQPPWRSCSPWCSVAPTSPGNTPLRPSTLFLPPPLSPNALAHAHTTALLHCCHQPLWRCQRRPLCWPSLDAWPWLPLPYPPSIGITRARCGCRVSFCPSIVRPLAPPLARPFTQLAELVSC